MLVAQPTENVQESNLIFDIKNLYLIIAATKNNFL